jgi:hypothetical protein
MDKPHFTWEPVPGLWTLDAHDNRGVNQSGAALRAPLTVRLIYLHRVCSRLDRKSIRLPLYLIYS